MNWNFAVKYRDRVRGATPFAWFVSLGDASHFLLTLDHPTRYRIVDTEGNVIA